MKKVCPKCDHRWADEISGVMNSLRKVASVCRYLDSVSTPVCVKGGLVKGCSSVAEDEAGADLLMSDDTEVTCAKRLGPYAHTL